MLVEHRGIQLFGAAALSGELRINADRHSELIIEHQSISMLDVSQRVASVSFVTGGSIQ